MRQTYGLIVMNESVPAHAQACPETMRILEQIPGVTLCGFSRMEPGTEIAPHVGWAASVYRLHIGLLVPENCVLKVGDVERAYETGKVLIFDDTVEHEAWNRSSETRINLLLDFLRAGMTHDDNDFIPPEVVRYMNENQGTST